MAISPRHAEAITTTTTKTAQTESSQQEHTDSISNLARFRFDRPAVATSSSVSSSYKPVPLPAVNNVARSAVSNVSSAAGHVQSFPSASRPQPAFARGIAACTTGSNRSTGNFARQTEPQQASAIVSPSHASPRLPSADPPSLQSSRSPFRRAQTMPPRESEPKLPDARHDEYDQQEDEEQEIARHRLGDIPEATEPPTSSPYNNSPADHQATIRGMAGPSPMLSRKTFTPAVSRILRVL